MKALPFLAALLASPASPAFGEGYVNFIRQHQLGTGVVWSMPVQPDGTSPSQFPLEQDGALFQLWTIDQEVAKDHLLDQKVVGVYLPTASIAIRTLDPHGSVPRTRADQPFTVSIEVGGLLSGTGLPDAATRVVLEHHLASYDPGQTSLPVARILAGTPASSQSIGSNGTFTLNFPVTNLEALDPTLAHGEEHFVIHALGDGTIPPARLASAHVEVWPVASGKIEGIAEGDRVRFHAPSLTVSLADLYPRSNTWLQVYEGTPRLDTRGTRVPGSVLVLDQDRGDNRLLNVTNYDTVLPEDGTYTLELLTETPFGIDRLDHVTFMVDRKLEIRAQLGGIEGN